MQIPDLNIMDGGGGLLELQQSVGSGEFTSVFVHPIHVRLLAERLGLLRSADPHAALLARRLRFLHKQIDELSDWLITSSDHAHADLSHEVQMATALWQIAAEFVADLDDLPNTPESGALQHPQERVSSGAVPKAAPLGKNGTAWPKTAAERAKAYRQRHASRDAAGDGVTPVTPSIDQLELP